MGSSASPRRCPGDVGEEEAAPREHGLPDFIGESRRRGPLPPRPLELQGKCWLLPPDIPLFSPVLSQQQMCWGGAAWDPGGSLPAHVQVRLCITAPGDPTKSDTRNSQWGRRVTSLPRRFF